MKNGLSAYQIAQLIYKSVTKTINSEEKVILDHWLEQEKNRTLYNTVMDEHNIQDKFSIYRQIETKRIYENLEKKITQNNTKVRRLKTFKYAAIIIVLLGLGFIYQNGSPTKKPALEVPTENITLQLENGTIKILKEDGSSKVLDSKGNVIGSQKGTQIVYKKELEKERLVYNTLTVPYGKRFEISLSDGTNVHLNAGTSLKYPVKFIKGQDRQVFLKGEAFFSVAKDIEHEFIVNSDALNVQVYGTQFNISCYPEDRNTDVVLIEGSVGLYAKEDAKNTTLTPGFKGSYDKNASQITTSPVITSVYTSWMQGGLVFRNMTFGNILKKMERHYNIDITNNNQDLTNEKFNASFRNEPIEKILNYFKITYGIDFTIDDNKIIID